MEQNYKQDMGVTLWGKKEKEPKTPKLKGRSSKGQNKKGEPNVVLSKGFKDAVYG